jgi:hypothetical protein
MTHRNTPDPTIQLPTSTYMEVLDGMGDAFDVAATEPDEFVNEFEWAEWAVYKYEEALDATDNGHRVSDSVERAVKIQEARRRARRTRVQGRRQEAAEMREDLAGDWHDRVYASLLDGTENKT